MTTTASRRRPKSSAIPTPRAGTIRRAVWDAVHAVYCGAECHATCREWAPNRKAMDAAIDAVRKFDRSVTCTGCLGSGQVSTCGDAGCCLRPCSACGGSGRKDAR